MANPCLSCGVCCTMFRISFYWRELADQDNPQGVPPELTQAAPIPHRVMMRGTGSEPARCVALEGDLGGAVRCGIHERRPSPCRAFAASFEDGLAANPRCDDARARHGLRPLTTDDWTDPVPSLPQGDPAPPLRPAA